MSTAKQAEGYGKAIPPKLVRPISTAQRGSKHKDVVVNGGFDADSDWTKGTGWTIASSLASSDGTQAADSLLTASTDTLAVGIKYLTRIVVSARSAGSCVVKIGDQEGTDRSAVGDFSEVITHSGAGLKPIIIADATFVGDVTYFSALPIR